MKPDVGQSAPGWEDWFRSSWLADRPAAYRWATCCVAVAGVIIGAILWYRGAGRQQAMVSDTNAILDVSWRLYSGQIPHVDFSNALGMAPFTIMESGMRLTGPNANALAIGPLLFLPLILGWAWALARSRLSAAGAAVFVICNGLLFAGIQPLSSPIRGLSYAMFYNRMGWTWFNFVVLECLLPPRRPGGRSAFAGGLSTALAGTLLAFTKVNYAAGALLIIGAGLLLYRNRPVRWLGALAGFLTVVFLEVVGLRVSLAGYWRDQLHAVQAGSGGLAVSLIEATGSSAYELLLLLISVLLVGLCLGRRPVDPQWRFRGSALLGAIAVVGTSIFIVSANTQRGFLPPLIVAAAILAEQLGRSDPGRNAGSFRMTLGVLIVLALAVPIAGEDAASLAYGAWQTWRKPDLDETSRVNTPSLRSLLLPRWPGESDRVHALDELRQGVFTPNSYAVWINDGIDLLRRHHATSARILSFDYVNPFPFALGAPAPRGDLIFWHFGRLVNERNAPAGDRLFADVEDVMVPKFMQQPASTAIKERLYGTILRRDFAAVGESDCWVLWQRLSSAQPEPQIRHTR